MSGRAREAASWTFAFHDNTSPGRTLRELLVMPSLWPSAPVYIGVMLLASKRAKDKLRKRQEKVWERDDSSRT